MSSRRPLQEIWTYPGAFADDEGDESGHVPGFEWYHDPAFPEHALVVTDGARYTPDMEACRPVGAGRVYWIMRPARAGDRAKRVMWKIPAIVSVKTPGGATVSLVDCTRFESMADSRSYECQRQDAVADEVTFHLVGQDGACDGGTVRMAGARRFVVRRVAGVGMVLSAWTRACPSDRPAFRIRLDDTRALTKLAADAGVALPDALLDGAPGVARHV